MQLWGRRCPAGPPPTACGALGPVPVVAGTPGPFPGKHLALLLGARCQAILRRPSGRRRCPLGSGVTCSADYAIALLSIMGLST